jgi:hypothetical protein
MIETRRLFHSCCFDVSNCRKQLGADDDRQGHTCNLTA